MAQILKRVYEHLSLVKEDPSIPLENVLLGEIDHNIAADLSEADRAKLLGITQELLPILQQDASPLTSLVVRLIEPDAVTFEQVDNFLTQNHLLSRAGTSDDQYLKGLESQNRDINLLILNLLHKARKSPSGIGLVASKAQVVQAIIKAFLCSPDVSVAQQAAKVLEDFLLAGETLDDATVEKNLMVRRVFRDRDIYESLFSLSSLKTVGLEGQPSKKQKTISQARLLNLIVNIDHPSSPVRLSQFPEIERKFDITKPNQGILYYAFVAMMSLEDDDLLLSTFLHLCTKYLTKDGPPSYGSLSHALIFLKENHLHQICISHFIDPDPESGAWLLADAAKYLHWYCAWFEEDLLKDKDLCTQLLEILRYKFQSTSRTDWHVNDALSAPLHILAALPRRLLVPKPIEAIDGLPPLFDVPAYSDNPYVLLHLQRIFCETKGPHKSSSHGSSTTTTSTLTVEHRVDRMTARVLYLKYLERNPNFWEKVVELADSEAAPSRAFTAINFMHTFAKADWELVDQSLAPFLPSEEELVELREGYESPSTGLQAMLLENGVAFSMAAYFFSSFKPHKANKPEVQQPSFDYSKDPARSQVARAKYHLTIHIRDLLEKELRRGGSSPLMEELLDGFNERVRDNKKAMSDAQAAARQEGGGGAAASVATMRR